jgi:hypothetical protein
MQEVAQMAAWVKQHPGGPGDDTRAGRKKAKGKP